MMKENDRKTSEKRGKRRVSVLMAALLAVGMLTATACGMAKVNFSGKAESEKRMTFEAKNASKGQMVMIGSLEVEDGEELKITPELKRGMLKLEFIPEDEAQSMEKLPDIARDALITAELSGTGAQAYGIPAGSYTVRATVTENAKGKVAVEIQAE